EVAELLLHDLPAPAAGAALPHTGLDAIAALNAVGPGHRVRLTQRHGHRMDLVQGQLAGVLEVIDAHRVLRSHFMKPSIKPATPCARRRRQGALAGSASTRSSCTKLRM